MHAATEGLFVLLRGTTFLAAAILGVFATVLRYDAHRSEAAGAARDAICPRVVNVDSVRNENWPFVPVLHRNDLCCDDGRATAMPSDFVSEEFDVARDGKWLIIPVTIDGKDYHVFS